MARKLVKFLHSVSAIGMSGGLAAYIAVLLVAPEITEIAEHVALRTSLATVSKWLILPSMLVVLVTGLLSMIVHYPFMSAPWVWAKALTGLLIFEATLASLDAPAQAAKKAMIEASAGTLAPERLEVLVRDEWMAWWILLGLAVANVALGIWRPRFGIKPSS
ncbi:MAG: DUF2269 family protein [Pseudomonadota bacterium]